MNRQRHAAVPHPVWPDRQCICQAPLIDPVHECGELLADPDGYIARCVEPWGVEHSHHDHTAREAVAVRRARAIR